MTTILETGRVHSGPQETVRADLSVAHRVAERFGMTDLIYTHFSARDPLDGDLFYITPYGHLFHEIDAGTLSHIRMTEDGMVVEGRLNPAGAVIHEAVYAARPDVGAICHTHTRAGVAVSCLKDGLLPISQFSLRFHGRVGYHDYEGATLVPGERTRLQESVSGVDVVILRNHGLLTMGRSVREALSRMYFLERACQVQIDALATGRPLVIPSEEIAAVTRDQYAGFGEEDMEERMDLEWAALCRLAASQGGHRHA